MTIAGIVAGGTGSRMGNASLPKQFYEIGSQTVITYTVGRFLAYSGIDAVIIGIAAGHPPVGPFLKFDVNIFQFVI